MTAVEWAIMSMADVRVACTFSWRIGPADGISAVDMTMIHRNSLQLSTWYGAGNHRESQQRKIPVSAVF